tara:strand:+ start:280 stop:1254 length:975 start_codon:yes stop_codon:yes gene_type:complete
MNKILILGVNSFSGSTLASFLQKKNTFKLYATYHSKKNTKYLLYNKKKLTLKKINNLNHKTLINFINKISPDYIIDFASICMVNESWEHKNYYMNVNYFSKKKLLYSLKNNKNLKKYIYISTPEIFGSNNKILEDSKNYNPSTPYAESKLKAELLLEKYYKKFNFPGIICRFSNFYGPGQPIYRLIPKACIYLDNNQLFPIDGSGLSKRNFIYSDDFARGIYLTIKKGKVGNKYHFCSSKTISIMETVRLICKFKKKRFDTCIKFNKERRKKDKIYKLNNKMTSKSLNWFAKTSFEDGLKKTIKFYVKNNKLLKKEHLVYKFIK